MLPTATASPPIVIVLVTITLYKIENFLVIEQTNRLKKEILEVESNGIGLESIRKIIQQYEGTVNVECSLEFFRITLQISL